MSAESQNARAVVDQFIAALAGIHAGEKVDYLDYLADDAVFTITGRTPLSGTYNSVEEIRARFRTETTKVMGKNPGYGIFPTRYIQEGNEIVVLAKGRSGNMLGQPYNNSYFLYFRVEGNKVVHYVENFDASLAWRAVFGCHLG